MEISEKTVETVARNKIYGMSAPPESEWPRRSDARVREKKDRLNEDVRGFVELVRICSPVCVGRVDSLRAQRQTVRECSHSQQHFRVIYFYRNFVCPSVSCWKERKKGNTSVCPVTRRRTRECVSQMIFNSDNTS